MFKSLLNHDFFAIWLNFIFTIFIKVSIVLTVPLIINIIHKKSAAEFRHLLLFISISMLFLLPFLPEPVLTFDFPSLQQKWDCQNNSLLRTDANISNSHYSNFKPPVASETNSNAFLLSSKNNNPGIGYYLALLTFIIWFAGSLFLITYLLISVYAVYRMKKRGNSLSDPEWNKTLKNLCAEFKINRPIQLINGANFRTPFTFGLIRPFIYLPNTFKKYTTEERRCILLHELSHIKRNDTLTYFIARFIVALYWFNPLAWLALRILRLEQEKACDDRVLNYGIKPSDYATHLLNFLRESRPNHPVAALGVSSFKTIKSRIGQILNPIRRRSLLNTKMCITAITIVVFLTVTVATFGPAAIATEDSMSAPNTKQTEYLQSGQSEQLNNTAPISKTKTNHKTAPTSISIQGNIKPKTDVSNVTASGIPSLMPINGNIISFFGKRFHEKLKAERLHSGIDIEAQIGTTVKATANGTVIKAEFDGGYGLMMEIVHQDEISTVYAHLSSLSVKPGQIILQGEVIGYSGNTGLTTGPHLHYEIRVKGQPVDPLIFINQDNTQANHETEKTASQSEENLTASHPNFMKPVPFTKVSSPFGLGIDPITEISRVHSGIDIPLPIGTPVKASADGQVVKAERSGASGILVIIEHQNNYSTYYAKLSQALVKAGDTVKQGDIIAYSGNSGRSTGPHLHFELREQDQPVNPMLFFETLNNNNL